MLVITFGVQKGEEERVVLGVQEVFVCGGGSLPHYPIVSSRDEDSISIIHRSSLLVIDFPNEIFFVSHSCVYYSNIPFVRFVEEAVPLISKIELAIGTTANCSLPFGVPLKLKPSTY